MLTLLRLLLTWSLAAMAAAQGAESSGFLHSFGAPGAPGSFRARFARDGGGLVFLQATDHYVSLAAAKKAQHGPDDWLLLAWNGSDHALRLFAADQTALGVDPSTARWTATADGDVVRFELDGGKGLVLEKVIRHQQRQRGFVVEFALRNTGSAATGSIDLAWTGPMLVVPHESSLFGTLAKALAVPREGDTQVCTPQAGATQPLAVDARLLQFAGSTNRFFGAFVWPGDDAAAAALSAMQVETGPGLDDASSGMRANTSTRLRYGLRLAVPAVGEQTRVAYGLYLGPKSYRVFESLPEPERFAAVIHEDLASPCCGIDVPGGRFMGKLLLRLLGWFHDAVGSWGVAIMMLTILVRGLLAPLNFRMQKSMRAYSARMAVLKPKLDALKTKYGDDQRAYQQAMIAFQREHKLIPPLGGCLPIFLTMPIYLGLFTALRTAYDVRQQPFAWMTDLSAPDQLFALPFFPQQFNLLPLLWIAMFLWLQLRTPLPTDPQQRQMMAMMRFMPILFGVMLYYYASALMVYMVTSMLWSIAENAIVKRILGPMDPNNAAMTPQMI